MNTETQRITVGGLAVEVVRKAIKNLHLGVYPPHGRVRVAAPLAVSEDAVRLAVITRLGDGGALSTTAATTAAAAGSAASTGDGGTFLQPFR